MAHGIRGEGGRGRGWRERDHTFSRLEPLEILTNVYQWGTKAGFYHFSFTESLILKHETVKYLSVTLNPNP